LPAGDPNVDQTRDLTKQTVQRKFQEYYLRPNFKVVAPQSMEKREYGFLLFKEKFMVRHRAFKNTDSLVAAIRDLTPQHVYFSTSYYSDPTLPMEQKGWLGADLVLDIDADHLDTPCKKSHDTWKCKGCSTAGTGQPPKVCPNCKNDRLEVETWLCEQCLRQAKEETINLMEMLSRDFQPDESKVRIFFSGHRGYHVYLFSEEYRQMDEQGRREVVDYLLGNGLDPQYQGLDEVTVPGTTIIQGPLAGEEGWRGRIFSGLYDVITQEGLELGLTSGQVQTLKGWNKDLMFTKPFWSSLKGIQLQTWKLLISKAVERKAARIDTVVTTDTHRLIRLPGTLNGGTGLLALNVPAERLDEFDPFSESVAFDGKLKVHVRDAPAFRLGDNELGPFKDEAVELPTAAAMLLLCKRRAQPVN
jgi:DNA primase small subunit